MSAFTISAAARVNAPARRVYDVIADYRNGHPRIEIRRLDRRPRPAEGHLEFCVTSATQLDAPTLPHRSVRRW